MYVLSAAFPLRRRSLTAVEPRIKVVLFATGLSWLLANRHLEDILPAYTACRLCDQALKKIYSGASYATTSYLHLMAHLEPFSTASPAPKDVEASCASHARTTKK